MKYNESVISGFENGLVHHLARRSPKIAAVALANKMARMIWAMMMT
jgi:hypothetical protein